jgi:hypothetical protein
MRPTEFTFKSANALLSRIGIRTARAWNDVLRRASDYATTHDIDTTGNVNDILNRIQTSLLIPPPLTKAPLPIQQTKQDKPTKPSDVKLIHVIKPPREFKAPTRYIDNPDVQTRITKLLQQKADIDAEIEALRKEQIARAEADYIAYQNQIDDEAHRHDELINTTYDLLETPVSPDEPRTRHRDHRLEQSYKD